MYNPYQNFQYNPYLTPQYNSQKIDIVKVNGENGARAYQLPPNSNILLLDESGPIVWLAQTDGAGYKTVTPYKITPYKPEPPIDVKSLEDRISRLEGIINAKPDDADVAGFKNATSWKLTEHKTDDEHYSRSSKPASYDAPNDKPKSSNEAGHAYY